MSEYLETPTHDELRKHLHAMQVGLLEANDGLRRLTREGKAQFTASRLIQNGFWKINQALIETARVLKRVPDEMGVTEEMAVRQGDQS